MNLLYGHDEVVAGFVAQILPAGAGFVRGFGKCKAIGVIDKDGRLVGGVVFHNWHPEAGVMEVSAASIDPRWMAGTIHRRVFAYPFDQAGCQLIVLKVRADNERMASMARRIGFDAHLIPRMYGRESDGFIFTLTDDAWRQSRFHERTS